MDKVADIERRVLRGDFSKQPFTSH
jgi:hypothetical protein